jgi:hypothetical protein
VAGWRQWEKLMLFKSQASSVKVDGPEAGDDPTNLDTLIIQLKKGTQTKKGKK